MTRFGICLVLFATACSGADGTGLLGDSGQEDASSGTDAAVQQQDSGVPDVSTQDAHTDDVKVVDATPDVHVGPPDSKIQCGSSLTCSAQKEVCCWHMASTVKPYECVSDVSACGGTYDVPMSCSKHENCASQGNPSDTCCATGGNAGTGQCYGYDVATVVACKASCTGTQDFEIGCDIKTQNCADSLQTCIVSQCTAPGDTICN